MYVLVVPSRRIARVTERTPGLITCVMHDYQTNYVIIRLNSRWFARNSRDRPAVVPGNKLSSVSSLDSRWLVDVSRVPLARDFNVC